MENPESMLPWMRGTPAPAVLHNVRCRTGDHTGYIPLPECPNFAGMAVISGQLRAVVPQFLDTPARALS